MLTAGYDGAVIKSPAGLDGKVNLDIPSIGRLAAWLGQPLDPKQPDPGPLQVAATLAADGPRIALRPATAAGQALKATAERSDERGAGKEWGSPGRSRWSPHHQQK